VMTAASRLDFLSVQRIISLSAAKRKTQHFLVPDDPRPEFESRPHLRPIRLLLQVTGY